MMNNEIYIKEVEGEISGVEIAPSSYRKFRRGLTKKSNQFKAYFAPSLKRIREVGGGGYNSLVKGAIKTYGKAKHFSRSEEGGLTSYAKKSWRYISKP